MRNIFWAEISDLQSAKTASQTAGGFAWFMGVFTALMVYLQTSGKVDLDLKMDASNYIDAGILFILGGGLLMRSRVAAVLAITYVVLNRVLTMMEYGPGSGIFATIIQVAVFTSGVRGAFAYHDILKAEKKFNDGAPPVEVPAPGMEMPVTKSKTGGFLKFMPIIAGLLFVFGLGIIVMLMLKPTGPKTTVREFNVQDNSAPAVAVSDVSEKAPAVKITEGASGEKSFKLKTGETVSGRVVYDDPVYYTLENSGREFIVIKEDISQEINP